MMNGKHIYLQNCIRTAPVDIYHGIEELEKENELSIRTAPVDIYRNHINNLYHGR